MLRFLPAIAAVLISGTSVGAAIGSRETARLAAAEKVVRDVFASTPADSWTRAQCVAVFPDLAKSAGSVGGQSGRGVISCRAGERWSAPAFVQVQNGNWPFSRDAQRIDGLLLIMNARAVQGILQQRVVLRADDMLSYSRANGVVSGAKLSGVVLRPDAGANAAVYGKGASPRTILASREISAPIEAQWFLRALNAQPATDDRVQSPQRSAAQTPAPPGPGTSARTTTVPTTDDDVRTRVVDIQQMLDRLLADTTPSPVGTSGNTPAPAGTVTVDRVRLMQVREQLDALLAALNRR